MGYIKSPLNWVGNKYKYLDIINDLIKEREYEEVIEAMEEFGGGAKKTEEELGDLIFAVVNLSRFLDVNPEVALNRTINKFIKRFEFIEEELSSQGKDIENSNLEEMDILWNKAKMHNIH